MQIKKIFLLLFTFTQIKSFDYYQSKTFTLMINPAGDAKDAGRMLNDSFERGITLQFAQELKQVIEQYYTNVSVVLTRIAGETLEFLQNANFANKLDVDFYLSIHFYKETEVRPKLFLYHYLNNPFFTQLPATISFINYHNAHLFNINKTLDFANKMKQVLEKQNQFDFKYLLGIPFVPLVGIKAPAIAIEAGLKNSDDYKEYVKPIFTALSPILIQNSYIESFDRENINSRRSSRWSASQ